MNNWGIPDELEKLVRSRDSKCIYCGKIFAEAEKRGDFPSWEHIINDARIISEDNIALCCISCNSSKGAKALIDWLNSGYCKRNSIEYKRLAPVVKKKYLENSLSESPK